MSLVNEASAVGEADQRGIVALDRPHFSLEVGGVLLEVRSTDDSLRLGLPARMEAFRSVTEPGATEPRPPGTGRIGSPIVITAGWGDPALAARGDLVFDSGALWRLYRSDEGDWRFVFSALSPTSAPVAYKSATLNADFTQGAIVLERRLHPGPVNPLEYPLDELLLMHHLAFSAASGIELHASGLRDGAEGFLFVGQSGAGKTTAARLWLADRGGDVLSDDRIIVRPDPSPAAGCWMWGTPWHGTGRFATPGPARLRGLYLLQQATETRLRPLPKATALGRLLAAAFFPFHEPTAIRRAIQVLEAVLAQIPCQELRFRPDGAFISQVRAAAGLLPLDPPSR